MEELSPDADAISYVNDPNFEMAWAAKAHKAAETHWNMISSLDHPASFHFTKHDDLIYNLFRRTFPDLDVNVLLDPELHSDQAKAIWRAYCYAFEEVVDEYNLGSLLRFDPAKPYVEENTCVVTRIQFLAIEIARNREGVTAKALGKTPVTSGETGERSDEVDKVKTADGTETPKGEKHLDTRTAEEMERLTVEEHLKATTNDSDKTAQ